MDEFGRIGYRSREKIWTSLLFTFVTKLSLIDIKQQRDKDPFPVSPLTILMYSILHQHLVVLVIVVPMHNWKNRFHRTMEGGLHIIETHIDERIPNQM